MVSHGPQADQASSSDTDSTPGTPADPSPPHWLEGRFFVPVPDLSDEVRQQISKGRAWPVFMAIMSLLHDRARRGPREQRAASKAGRIEGVGICGLAAASGQTDRATLRQVRVLEAIGLIRTTQERFTQEADPTTGRFVRNYRKVPPKALAMTLADTHLRPTVSTRKRGQSASIQSIPNGAKVGIQSIPKGTKGRDTKYRVSKERTPKEFSPLERKQRTADPALGSRPSAVAPGNNSAAPPAGTRTALELAGDVAALLGMSRNAAYRIILAGPADRQYEELRQRYREAKAQAGGLTAASQEEGSIDQPASNEVPDASQEATRTKAEETKAKVQESNREPAQPSGRVDHPDPTISRSAASALVQPSDLPGGRRDCRNTLRPDRRVQADPAELAKLTRRPADPAAGSCLEAYRQGTGQVTAEAMTPDEAAAGLREALEELPDSSRERARELGETIDPEAAMLKAIVEKQLAKMAGGAA